MKKEKKKRKEKELTTALSNIFSVFLSKYFNSLTRSVDKHLIFYPKWYHKRV